MVMMRPDIGPTVVSSSSSYSVNVNGVKLSSVIRPLNIVVIEMKN